MCIDEPSAAHDWDGNELLLSDILGTEEDEACRALEDETKNRRFSGLRSFVWEKREDKGVEK